jgi:hypothetical protein
MISTVVSKCSTGHILHAGLAGKPNIPVFDILSGFQASDFKDKIAREAFSAAACQKKGSVYNAFYDAVKNKDSQRAVIILRIAAYLPPQKREEFFKQALCSSRPEPPVLQHLYEQRRSELLNCILVHTFNLGKTSVQIKKLMEALKAGPSAPLPPFNEMMNGVEGSKPGSPEMKIA